MYNTSSCPIFFLPEDAMEGEEFRMITPEVAQDVLPYYAISNYGRVENINTGKIMKPNYRVNGYEYLCLAAENCKNGQKKYTTHRLVLKTFEPRDDMDDLEVNHIYGDKSENYINKIMPDGSKKSSIEWSTRSKNCKHRNATGLQSQRNTLTDNDANHIRLLHDKGYTYSYIQENYYPYISNTTIQNICRNRSHKDENYTPRDYNEMYRTNLSQVHKLIDIDAEKNKKLL